jgi:hypothetical protein
MPGARTVAIAIGVGLLAGIYVELWIRWPTFVAVGVGAVMAILLLMIASSLGEDPARADAAWREAAPDLVAPEPAPLAPPESTRDAR